MRGIIAAYTSATLLALLLVTWLTHSSATTCAPSLGSGTPTRLSTLSAAAVAGGSLQLTTDAVWDFEGRPGVLTGTPGTAVNLSCLTALNATVAAPSAAAGSVFLQPTALDLSAASGLSMAGVSLSTDCATVLAYQQYLCTSLRAAGSLTMEPGVVRFGRWRDGFTSLDNVNLTCATSAGAAAVAVPCRLVSVQTAAELLEAFTVYAAAAAAAGANLTVIVAANLSVSNRTILVPVTTNVTIAGSALLTRPVLDLGLLTDAWSLGPAVAVVLANLTLANLSPAYYSPGYVFSQFGILSERVWAFQRFGRQLHMNDVTLVVAPDELSYSRYWLTWLVSPDPEANAKASWLKVFDISIAAVNSTGIYYDSFTTFTATYDHVRLTSTLGNDYPLMTPAPSVLQQLLTDRTPLTAVNPVMNTSDLLLAMVPNNSVPDDAGRRWIFFINNMSLADGGVWPHTGVAISGSNVMGVGPLVKAVTIGLGGRAGLLVVPSDAMLTLRGVVLSELAPRSNATAWDSADPLAVLSSPLWGVSLAAGASKTRLENCTLVVSAEELQLLQQALLPAAQLAAVGVPGPARGTGANGTANGTEGSGAPQRPFDSALVAAAQAFFTAGDDLQTGNATVSRLVINRGTTMRYVMNNVTFRVPGSGEQANAGLRALGVPYDDGSSSSGGGTDPWVIGVAVGCAVGGALLLVAAAAVFVGLRRRRRGQQPSGKAKRLAVAKLADGNQQGGDRDGSSVGMATGQLEFPPGAPAGVSHGAAGSDGIARELATKAGEILSVQKCISTVGLTSSTLETSTATGAMGPYTAASSGPAAPAPAGGQPTISVALSSGGTMNTPYSNASAAVALAAAGFGIHADSFDQAATTSMIGAVRQQQSAAAALAAAALATRSPSPSYTQSQRSGVRDAGSAGAQSQGSGPATGSGVRGGGDAGAAASSTSGLMSSIGGTSLDQMRGVIAALGRDLADNKQLHVHGVIGKGAHGTVYRGTWRGLSVAIKSMMFGPDDHARHQQRPLMEAAISSNLTHPNIVTTYC